MRLEEAEEKKCGEVGVVVVKKIMVAKRDWLRELKEVSAVDPGFAVAGGGGGGLIVAVDERWLSV